MERKLERQHHRHAHPDLNIHASAPQISQPRLLFITSGTSTLAGTENMALPVNKYPPRGWPKTGFSVPAYRSSKTGMNMMMREWHRTLHEDGVKVWAVSPGFLATGLGAGKEFNAKMGAKDPADAGEFIKTVVEGGCGEGCYGWRGGAALVIV